MIFNHSIALTNFSQSNLLDPTVMESFHSSLELNGNILHGLKFHSLSLLKIKITLRPDIIKSILEHWLDVFLERISVFFYLSEPTSKEPLTLKLSFMDSKWLQTKFSEAILLSKFKSLTLKLMQLVLLSASQLLLLPKFNPFLFLILDGEVILLVFIPEITCSILILPQHLFHIQPQLTWLKISLIFMDLMDLS